MAKGSTRASTAAYIYCLVEQARAPAIDQLAPGLPGAAPPRAVAVGSSLWAIVSDVPLARYGPDRLESRLQDINWVADIGVRHEAIVERLAAVRGSTVLPMKLFTMFSSVERAIDDLRAQRPAIAAILRRVRGCQEWGVRVTRLRSGSAPRPDVPPVTSGTAFLTAKKRVRDQARARVLQSSEAAEAAFASLSALARAAVRHEAPRGALAPPLVDAAFLVRHASTARFRAAVRRAAAACRTADASLALTGPWPPYNFISTPDPNGHA